MIQLPSPSAMMTKARRTVTLSTIATARRATKSTTIATARQDTTSTMATDVNADIDVDGDNNDDDGTSSTMNEGDNCRGQQLLS